MDSVATDELLELVKRPTGPIDHKPDWRWRRATELASRFAHVPESIEQTDPAMAKAARFRQALIWERQLGGDGTGLKAEFGELYTAFEIWSSPMLFEQRWILEAFLLVKTEPEEIARYTNQPVGVVMYFQALFFDVRRLLRYPMLAHCKFIDPLIRELGRARREVQLKLVAWMGGPDLLVEFLTADPEYTPEQAGMAVGRLRNLIQHREFQRALGGSY